MSLSEHAVIGHWKKALREVGDSQALNRALLGDRKKKKKIKLESENLPNLLLPRIESYQKGLFKLFLKQQEKKKKNPSRMKGS